MKKALLIAAGFLSFISYSQNHIFFKKNTIHLLSLSKDSTQNLPSNSSRLWSLKLNNNSNGSPIMINQFTSPFNSSTNYNETLGDLKSFFKGYVFYKPSALIPHNAVPKPVYSKP